MTWIRTAPYERAGPELKRVYEELRALYPPECRRAHALPRPAGRDE